MDIALAIFCIVLSAKILIRLPMRLFVDHASHLDSFKLFVWITIDILHASFVLVAIVLFTKVAKS